MIPLPVHGQFGVLDEVARLLVAAAVDLGTIDPAVIRLMSGGRQKLVEINDYLKYNKMYKVA